MPGYVRAALNQLRGFRNDLAHKGFAEKKPPTSTKVAECLAGAAFGFHYVRLAEEHLTKLRGE